MKRYEKLTHSVRTCERSYQGLKEEIIVSGFGGQGIIFIGRLLAHAGLLERRNVTCLPSYGPEMRGGTAHCFVVISDHKIGSPLFSNPSSLIAMNRPSLDRFESEVEPNGCILVNSSLIDREVKRSDLVVAEVKATSIAEELGNVRGSNMVALGAYIAIRPVVQQASLISSLEKVLKRKELISMNEQAIKLGAQSVQIKR